MLLSIRKFSISCRVLLVLCAATLASCSDDDAEPAPTPPAALTGKSILGFAFPDVTPGMAGIVDEASKTIAVTVPATTDVKALKATITLSEGASVSPAAGEAQDFSKPVTYTVTAADGSKQAYNVTVTAKNLSFTITEVPTEVVPGSYFGIKGYGFGSYLLNKVVLKNIETGQLFYIYAASISVPDEYLFFQLYNHLDMPMGDYQVTIISGTERLTLSAPLKLYTDKLLMLTVDGVDETNYTDYVISGVNFSASGNKVELYNESNGETYVGVIKKESTTSITLDRTNLPSDNYQVRLTNAGGETYEHSESVYVGRSPSLIDFNADVFKLGDTMIGRGERLKSDGNRITRFSFYNRDNGSSMERDAEVSEDETTVSFTFDDEEKFTPGSYEVYVYVNEKIEYLHFFSIIE
jgi:hypothetical protein